MACAASVPRLKNGLRDGLMLCTFELAIALASFGIYEITIHVLFPMNGMMF